MMKHPTLQWHFYTVYKETFKIGALYAAVLTRTWLDELMWFVWQITMSICLLYVEIKHASKGWSATPYTSATYKADKEWTTDHGQRPNSVLWNTQVYIQHHKRIQQTSRRTKPTRSSQFCLHLPRQAMAGWKWLIFQERLSCCLSSRFPHLALRFCWGLLFMQSLPCDDGTPITWLIA